MATRCIILLSTILISVVFLTNSASATSPDPVYMCDSHVYCQGPILEAVNRLEIFNDSKQYVDMALKKSQADTLTEFNKQFPDSKNISTEALKLFLKDHFYEPGGELTSCKPNDWVPAPGNFGLIKDDDYRQWALDLHQIWLQLCRRINDTVLKDFDKNSLLYVPNNFIAPGGRFREYYYWDTYWIVKGLLASQMYNTSKDIIHNFAYLVDKHGFIPNGGRVYYMERSQPPFFIPMVYEYFSETQDTKFLQSVMASMTKELEFWKQNRTVSMNVDGRNFTVYRFDTSSNTPRPEMFQQDVKLASLLNDESLKPMLYRDIATGAESGMDFGSRYFGDQTSMITIRTSDILPVDLNAVLCWAYKIMHSFHSKLGNHEEAQNYMKDHLEFREMIERVFYNNTAGTWFDRDVQTGQHRTHFYPSNAAPLFTGCYDTLDTSKPMKLYAYMNDTGALSYPSGIPSSLIETGQQWDLPNGWAPQNHMIIEGFRKSGYPRAQEHAYEIAKAWLKVNYLVYKRTGHMFEKYNVTDTTYQPGGGGEYFVQTGFGWTNGIVLDLLRTYGSRLEAPVNESVSSHVPVSHTATSKVIPTEPSHGASATWRVSTVQVILSFIALLIMRHRFV